MDLKALSCVSKRFHADVANPLWQSVTIRASSEFDLHRLNTTALPQVGLQLARELHFRSSFEYVTQNRCPHAENYLDEKPLEFSSEGKDGDEDPNVELFERLTQKAKAVLQRLEDNQLHTFR